MNARLKSGVFHQRGLATVEFALVAFLLMLTTFGVVEFGRLLYTYSVLSEATRRGARVAAVCPMNDASVRAAATFGGTITIPGFAPENVQVDYLNESGVATATFAAIRYVRVQITGLQYDMHLPMPSPPFEVPPFAVTLPAESLGLVQGASMACQGTPT